MRPDSIVDAQMRVMGEIENDTPCTIQSDDTAISCGTCPPPPSLEPLVEDGSLWMLAGCDRVWADSRVSTWFLPCPTTTAVEHVASSCPSSHPSPEPLVEDGLHVSDGGAAAAGAVARAVHRVDAEALRGSRFRPRTAVRMLILNRVGRC